MKFSVSGNLTQQVGLQYESNINLPTLLMNNSTHTFRWNPPAEVSGDRPGIYLLHGTGEHAGRYEHFAERLAAAGWQVGAHDHPGHGRSSGKRGLIHPAGSLVTQAAIQIQAFAKETNRAPIVFGHSLGGVIATELVLQHGIKLSGLILSAPAYAPITTITDRIKLRLLTLLAPRWCIDLGYDAGRLTHDKEMQAEAYADELIHGFKSANFVGWLIRAGRRCIVDAEKFDMPALLLVAGADKVVDSNETLEFARRSDNDDLVVKQYEGLYHELLKETPEQRERVTRDIEEWLEGFR